MLPLGRSKELSVRVNVRRPLPACTVGSEEQKQPWEAEETAERREERATTSVPSAPSTCLLPCLVDRPDSSGGEESEYELKSVRQRERDDVSLAVAEIEQLRLERLDERRELRVRDLERRVRDRDRIRGSQG